MRLSMSRAVTSPRRFKWVPSLAMPLGQARVVFVVGSVILRQVHALLGTKMVRNTQFGQIPEVNNSRSFTNQIDNCLKPAEPSRGQSVADHLNMKLKAACREMAFQLLKLVVTHDSRLKEPCDGTTVFRGDAGSG